MDSKSRINRYVRDTDPMSEARVSTESITTLIGPASTGTDINESSQQFEDTELTGSHILRDTLP
jgi:hypothetical protein